MASRRAAAVLLAAAVLAGGGCSTAISGTPVAAPGAFGAGGGGDPLATTCREYTAMPDVARREVMAAIATENQLVAANPDIWVGVATALCSFADPGAPVRDVVTGGIR